MRPISASMANFKHNVLTSYNTGQWLYNKSFAIASHSNVYVGNPTNRLSSNREIGNTRLKNALYITPLYNPYNILLLALLPYNRTSNRIN